MGNKGVLLDHVLDIKEKRRFNNLSKYHKLTIINYVVIKEIILVIFLQAMSCEHLLTIANSNNL